MRRRIRFNYMKFRSRFSDNFPIAHISVIRAVDLADALRFDNRPLKCFCGNYSAHTDTISLRNRHSHCTAPQIRSVEIGNTFLTDGFDCESQLIGQRFIGIPHIGWFQRFGMGNLRLELFGS